MMKEKLESVEVRFQSCGKDSGFIQMESLQIEVIVSVPTLRVAPCLTETNGNVKRLCYFLLFSYSSTIFSY